VPFGYVTQFTAVIPSTLAAFAMALLIFGLGREMFGAQAGSTPALIAVTMQGTVLHGRIPMPDMLMTAFHHGEPLDSSGGWRAARRARGSASTLRRRSRSGQGAGGFLPLVVALAWARRAEARPPAALSLPLGLPLLAAIVAPWRSSGSSVTRRVFARRRSEPALLVPAARIAPGDVAEPSRTP